MPLLPYCFAEATSRCERERTRDSAAKLSLAYGICYPVHVHVHVHVKLLHVHVKVLQVPQVGGRSVIHTGALCDTVYAANSEMPRTRGAAPPFRSSLSDPTACTGHRGAAAMAACGDGRCADAAVHDAAGARPRRPERLPR